MLEAEIDALERLSRAATDERVRDALESELADLCAVLACWREPQPRPRAARTAPARPTPERRRPVVSRALAAAQAAWYRSTRPSDRVNRAPDLFPFRRFGDAVAWVEWRGPEPAMLMKVETLAPGKGAASRLLRHLIAIADAHRIRLAGVAIAYATAECADAESATGQQRLEAWYRRLGFAVTADAFGVSHLRYR